MINDGFTKELDIPFEISIDMMREALKKNGLGILTETEINQKIREKLGIDMRKYVIMGAYYSTNANEAILPEGIINHRLPCNVIIYEDVNKTVLHVYDRQVSYR